MKSGDYSMCFSCDGYKGFGQLTLDGLLAKGRVEGNRLEGQISEAGRKLLAAIVIDLAPGVSGHRSIAGVFTCSMNGSASNDDFFLYGVGPLGIIIEIICQWAGSIDERLAERRASDRGPDRRGGPFSA